MCWLEPVKVRYLKEVGENIVVPVGRWQVEVALTCRAAVVADSCRALIFRVDSTVAFWPEPKMSWVSNFTSWINDLVTFSVLDSEVCMIFW